MIMHRCLALSLSALFAAGVPLAQAPAQAQAPLQERETAQEPALARTAQDPALQWGPCPAFLPEGCAIAVLHGDPAKNNADIFFKVPADAPIPRHWHTSAERMVMVSGELLVTYDGQEPIILKPGAYAYGAAKHPHKGHCAPGDPCVLFIAFELPIDAVPVDDSAPQRP